MRFAFADIEVDSQQVKITKNGKQIVCEPRVFELLVYFCNHPQEAISREELVAQVWGGRVVSDAAVNRAIGELRKLLEDEPSSPLWIKTVSKVGYRLAVTPSLLGSQGVTQKEHAYIAQTQTGLAEITATQSAEINAASTKKQKIKGFLLITALVLSIITLFYQTIYAKKYTEALGVLGRQPVTSIIGSAFNPYYHTKTDTLVFLYRSDADSLAQIYRQEANGSPQAITDDEYYYTDVIYGTDGFIYASRLDNLEQRHCEIVKIDPQTKAFSPILDCGTRVVTQLVFDERKRRLIYQYRSSISEPYAIHSYQLDTGRKQQLTHPEQVGNNLGDYIYALSADSQTLAVVEYSGHDVDNIKLVDLNDNHIIASSPFINNVSGLVWHSDNRILASNSDGLFEFNVNNFDLKTREYSDQFGRLALGADPLSILTERSQTRVNIFRYLKLKASGLSTKPTSTTRSTPLTVSSGISSSPILGNRSNILAFKSDRTGTQEIYIQAENKAAFIAEFEGTIDYIGGMAWSPDDDNVVASINNVLYLYSLTSKHWQRLAEHYTQVHQVTFVKESILFSAEVDGQWNIWQLSLDNGQVQQVTTKGGYSVQRNGSKVYFTKFNSAGLYQLDLKTGIESTLIEAFPIAGWRHWQWRDDKIYYLLNKEYRELNLKTAIERVVYTFSGRTPNSCNMAYQHDFFACDQVELSNSNIWQFQLPE
jgi:transcriptional activator of cad operon